MPLSVRNQLIRKIKSLITSLLKEYEHPYFLKKAIEDSDEFIKAKLLPLTKVHEMITLDDCLEMFRILLEFFDFMTAKTQAQIAIDCTRYKGFIKELAKLSLINKDEYKKRFPSTHGLKARVLRFAEDFVTETATDACISNIDSFEFQQLVTTFRRSVVRLEIERLLEEGYPPVGSSEYNDRVRDFERKNLFDRYFLGTAFIEWLERLSEKEIEKVIFPSSKSKKELLLMCLDINRNHEILKYIVYLTLYTDDSLHDIALQTGKNRQTVRKVGKILDRTDNPVTGKPYICYPTRLSNI